MRTCTIELDEIGEDLRSDILHRDNLRPRRLTPDEQSARHQPADHRQRRFGSLRTGGDICSWSTIVPAATPAPPLPTVITSLARHPWILPSEQSMPTRGALLGRTIGWT
jgi:hypothetical protein